MVIILESWLGSGGHTQIIQLMNFRQVALKDGNVTSILPPFQTLFLYDFIVFMHMCLLLELQVI